MPHSQGLSNNSILSRINPIPRIDIYLFNMRSNIALPTPPRPSSRWDYLLNILLLLLLLLAASLV